MLSILLFGSELWQLNAASLAKLESFHGGNVRAMARTTMYSAFGRVSSRCC